MNLSWTEENLFNDGDAFFNSLEMAIISAKGSIFLETYIFSFDEIGLKILNLLAEAAGRGVVVQLLLDGVGSSFWSAAHAEEWRNRGIEIRFFHPLPWQRKNSKIWDYFNFKDIRLRFSQLTQRNHSKVCIIDEQLAFIGSMNISACHSNSQKTAAWRDTSVRLVGPGIALFLNKFKIEWSNHKKHIGFYRREQMSNEQKHNFYHALIQHFNSAKVRIWLTTPYFSPNIKLIKILCEQAIAGVDVRLLFPKKSDVWAVKYAMESFYHLLLDSGVKIYEYTPSILHAKVSIVDQWVTVGSTNLDYLSLFYNLEADVVISNVENIESIGKQFLEDIRVSEEVVAEKWNQRSLFNRCMEKIFKSFIQAF